MVDGRWRDVVIGCQASVVGVKEASVYTVNIVASEVDVVIVDGSARSRAKGEGRECGKLSRDPKAGRVEQ